MRKKWVPLYILLGIFILIVFSCSASTTVNDHSSVVPRSMAEAASVETLSETASFTEPPPEATSSQMETLPNTKETCTIFIEPNTVWNCFVHIFSLMVFVISYLCFVRWKKYRKICTAGLVVAFIYIIVWVIPLHLRIPRINDTISMLLSFTRVPEYISAYVGFWGTMIGTFIAVAGALWTERTLKEEENQEKIKIQQHTYARMLYFDLLMCSEELLILCNSKIPSHTGSPYMKESLNRFLSSEFQGKEGCRKLLFNPDWIKNVADYSLLLHSHNKYVNKCKSNLSEEKIIDLVYQLYRYYGYMANINQGTDVCTNIGEFINFETYHRKVTDQERQEHNLYLVENQTFSTRSENAYNTIQGYITPGLKSLLDFLKEDDRSQTA